jgi:nucleoside-diphosphate-sugar epimerase
LNIVDDRPVSWRELFDFVAALHAAPRAGEGGPAGLPGFRVDNARAKQLLGWRPRFADYRTGWAAP